MVIRKNVILAAALIGLWNNPAWSGCSFLVYEGTKEFESLVALAEKGNPDSQCSLGSHYQFKHDNERMFYWYHKSAEQGQAESQYQLSLKLWEEKPEEAMIWLHKAAEQDFVASYKEPQPAFDSRLNLAQNYERGDSAGRVPIDRKKAVFWYEKAAAAGNPLAQKALERLKAGLLKGDPTQVTPVQQAAEQGDPDSQYKMGLLYIYDIPSRDYEKAHDLLLKAASQGHATAAIALGVLYEQGFIGSKDKTQALEWYRKADDYAQSHSKKKENRFSVDYSPWLLRENAQAGDVLALRIMGFRHVWGYTVRENPALAAFFYELAARRGLSSAQTAYDEIASTLSEEQRGKILSIIESWTPYSALADATGAWKTGNELAERIRKAENGDAQTQYRLGFDYSAGYDDVPFDKEKAVFWYKKAAENGHIDAQRSLAWIYERGEGIPRNSSEALKWYLLVAENNDANAQSAIGSLHQYGGDGSVAIDLDKAREWHLKAAELGNAWSQYTLGFMYEFGEGVPFDRQQAIAWYEKAAAGKLIDAQKALKRLNDATVESQGTSKSPDADQVSQKSAALSNNPAEVKFLARKQKAEEGDIQAQYELGMSYQYGRKSGYGVDRDPASAISWYEKAALDGHILSQNRLAAMYATGDGVDKDIPQAIRWFRMAADKGNDIAQNYLADFLLKIAKTPEERLEAISWYEKAADQGLAEAQKNLGLVYQFGVGGTTPDTVKARDWLEKAAKNGNIEAQGIIQSLIEIENIEASSD